MVTISVFDQVTKQMLDCYDFECVCMRDRYGIYYVIRGFFGDSYFSRKDCFVFLTTNVNDAMDKLDDLNSQLAEAAQRKKAVVPDVEGVTV